MKRGDIVTVAAGTGYGSKRRTAVIVHTEGFAATTLLTVCLLTSHGMDAPLLRLLLRPEPGHGLAWLSWITVEKIVTVPRTKTGRRLGALASGDVTRLNRTPAVIIGLAGS